MVYAKSIADAILAAENALLFHLSTFAKSGDFRDATPYYPQDLLRLRNLGPRRDICCSAMPLDSLRACDRGMIGDVGLVLSINSDDSLCGVSPGDMGSTPNDDGTRWIPPECIPHNDDQIRKSITERSGYNEWVVRDFTIRGILWFMPGDVTINADLDRLRVGVTEVSQMFPGIPCVSHRGGSLECPPVLIPSFLYGNVTQ